MIEITKISKTVQIRGEAVNIYRVIFEPGDRTRYDCAVLEWGSDYSFAPLVSRFNFPQRVNYWEIRGMGSTRGGAFSDVEKTIAKKYDCNPHTVRACIQIVNEIRRHEK